MEKKTEVKKEKQSVKDVEKTEKKESRIQKQPKEPSLSDYNSISFPHTTEKSIGLIERENTLVFIVDRRASKTQIKQSIEKAYGVKVAAVRTSITQHNFKKAFVRLNKDSLASEVAIRLGII